MDAQKKYRLSGKKRDNFLRWAYGISLKDYESMFEKQNGRCAICDEHPTGNGRWGVLAVDHCHFTDRVRGLLCGNCNKGIGLFKDDPNKLQTAINYLKDTGLSH